MSNPQQSSKAGGEEKPKQGGISIIIEGSDPKLIKQIQRTVVERLRKKNHEVLTDKDLLNNDERILLANQRLLDAAAITLAPETSSLFVAIKLQPRLQLIQQARNRGISVVQSVSWLGDAVYYNALGNTPVFDLIRRDFKDMRPDIWVVVDAPTSSYAQIAGEIGITVFDSERSAASIVSSIMDLISRHTSKRQQPPVPEVVESKNIQLSNLAYALVSDRPRLLDDSSNSNTYYRPDYLGPKIIGAYETILDKIMKNYDEAVAKLSLHLSSTAKNPSKSEKRAARIAQVMLPVSCVRAYQPLGQKIYSEKGSVVQTQDELSTFAHSLTPPKLDKLPEIGARLLSVSPANELDVITSALFSHVTEGVSELQNSLAQNSYDKKQEVLLATYMGSSGALDTMHYSFEVFSEFSAILALIDSGFYTKVAVQPLTPRYGYNMPDVIEAAGCAEIYEQSFDLSMELYSLLQAAGFPDEAQYAVLNGHRVRSQIHLNATHCIEIAKLNKSFELASLFARMQEQISERHPLFASTFHNK